MNWTFDQDAMITDEALLALDAARKEITATNPQAADMLGQAERIVYAGHVMVTDDETWVYDGAEGGWTRVVPSRCPHCLPDNGLCRHKLAAWLARHLAEADPAACQDEAPAAFHLPGLGATGATGSGTLGGIGPGYRGGRRSHSGGGRKGTCLDCTKCGFYKHGSCTNPNKKAGRGR
jgi:hypothetical protein